MLRGLSRNFSHICSLRCALSGISCLNILCCFTALMSVEPRFLLCSTHSKFSFDGGALCWLFTESQGWSTYLILLLSTKCRKSFKILLVLKKATKLPNRMLCTLSENRTITPQTNPYKPLFSLLRHQPALQEVTNTLINRISLTASEKIVSFSTRGKQLNSKTRRKGRKLRIKLMGSNTNKTYWIYYRKGTGRNKGFVLCAAHFRHVTELSSLAHQSQSLPECTRVFLFVYLITYTFSK